MTARWIAASACLLLTGCEGVFPEPDFERMIDQPRFQAYQPCRFFEDGAAMRVPPADTIPHDAPIWPPAVATGREGDRDVDRIPLPPASIDRAFVERGRRRYEIFCAACHGQRGDGRAPAALRMDLRPPPSLIDPPVRAYPPGRLFRAASEGYGLMPSYARQIAVEERWAIVAYLRALQLSQSVRLDALPPAERAAALRALR